MKLDTKAFKYLSQDDWRVLTAVEVGSKNHEVVPTQLISQLASLRTGTNGVQKCISTLAKTDLIARVRNIKYDGYRLTYGGLDYLALHAHTKSSSILHLGSQMGVGKESDIYLVTSPASPDNTKPVQSILKIHRLGRTSFRSLARNRAYHRHRHHCSWQYLSRLSAQKEYVAMCALYDAGFPVPKPVSWNRHTIVMSLVPGLQLKNVPLTAFSSLELSHPIADHERTATQERDTRVAALYESCIELALQLASYGLIHGDLNEFNILVENVPGAFSDPAEASTPSLPMSSESGIQSESGNVETSAQMKPHLIDFPQITSLSHPSAEEYFNRDVSGIKSFFRKRYHFEPEDEGPAFADALSRFRESAAKKRLDVEIEAAGFSKKMSRELENYFTDAQHFDEDGIDKPDKHEVPGNDVGTDLDEETQDQRESSEDERSSESKDTRNSNAFVPSPGIRGSSEINVTQRLSSISLQPDRNPASEPLHKAKAAAGWSI